MRTPVENLVVVAQEGGLLFLGGEWRLYDAGYARSARALFLVTGARYYADPGETACTVQWVCGTGVATGSDVVRIGPAKEATVDNAGGRISSNDTLTAMREYFARDEWSLGCGQCPDCHGGGIAFKGHPCYPKPKHLGHAPGCPRATFMEALGARVCWRTEAPLGFSDDYRPRERAQPKRSRADFDAFLKSVIEANEEPGQWAIHTSCGRLRELGFSDDEIRGAWDADGGWNFDTLAEIHKARN